MRGATLPVPQYVFVAWCLVKHRDSFTFYTYLLVLSRILFQLRKLLISRLFNDAPTAAVII